jgi:prevent-host-death family protein
MSELKIHASEILRNVRRHKTSYVITYRGQPVAILGPIQEPEVSATPSAQENWDELTRLGRKIAAAQPEGVSLNDVLTEMRR